MVKMTKNRFSFICFMKKRIFSMVLAETMAVAMLSGCGGGGNDGAQGTGGEAGSGNSTEADGGADGEWSHFIPIYIMILPGFLYLILNNYLPMFGMVIAFKDLDFRKGIFASDWAGFGNFEYLFASKDALTITRNTLGYNILFIILGIVFGVFCAIMLNEIQKKVHLKIFQTLILIPYLLSYVIVN